MNVYAVERRHVEEYLGSDPPDEIRAVRLSPGVVSEVAAWCGGISETTEDLVGGRRRTWVLVSTPGGVRPADIGDWIVREWQYADDDSSVTFRVYDQDEFLRRYEPVR